MNCPACNKILNPPVIPDTGSTSDTRTADTGSPEFLEKTEQDFYQQARRGRRRLHICSQRLWLTRVDALCGSVSGPSTFARMADLSYRPIAVAHATCCQVCLFAKGRPLLPICLSCALMLAKQRKLCLFVVRGTEVYSVNNWQRRQGNLRNILLRRE